MKKFNKSIILFSMLILSSLIAADLKADELTGKLFVGYQGWFSTPDNAKDKYWKHWGDVPAKKMGVDMWPDTKEYSASSLKATGMILGNGSPAMLFDSTHADVTDLHFKWMKEYDIDGIFYQRFVGELLNKQECIQPDSSFAAGSFTLNSGEERQLGCIKFIMQGDGVLVAYSKLNFPFWFSGPVAECSDNKCRAVFQPDGNLVLYSGSNPYWETKTSSSPGAHLVIKGEHPFVSIKNAKNETIYGDSHSNMVLRNIIKSAKTHSRKFVVEYDITGALNNPNCYAGKYVLPKGAGFSIKECIKSDWIKLVDEMNVTSGDNYFYFKGKPLVAIYGMGFAGDAYPDNAGDALALIQWFQTEAPAKYRASVFGGIPAYWRTLSVDSRSESGWNAVYSAFDIISPWMVGRYNNNSSAQAYINKAGKEDIAQANTNKQKYMPVIFPGFSWHNLMLSRDNPKEAIKNAIPRNAGKFYWSQIKAWKDLGVESMFGAMFDEVDEGTALFKTAATKKESPVEIYGLTLDVDGYSLPSDWYLQRTQSASYVLKGMHPPSKVMPLSVFEPGKFEMKGGETIKLTLATLSFQTDGNLVMYSDLGKVLWASNTEKSCASGCIAAYQGDGNLVFYKDGVPFFASNTMDSEALLVIADDAPNVFLAKPNGQQVWPKETK